MTLAILKRIKKMNDTVLKTRAWKSKQLFNMYKLVKLYANINTSVDCPTCVTHWLLFNR